MRLDTAILLFENHSSSRRLTTVILQQHVLHESVNSRPICTSDSRFDVYHQKECGGGQDTGFIRASGSDLIETISFSFPERAPDNLRLRWR